MSRFLNIRDIVFGRGDDVVEEEVLTKVWESFRYEGSYDDCVEMN
jgi:hypothetical protein